MDNTDIDFSDIIQRAVSLNDIRYLLAKLQQVWLFQYTFVNELESLRRWYGVLPAMIAKLKQHVHTQTYTHTHTHTYIYI